MLYRGKEKARLVPIAAALRAADADAPKTKDQPLFGLWKDRDDLADPAAYLRNLRHPRRVLAETSIEKRPGAGKPK